MKINVLSAVAVISAVAVVNGCHGGVAVTASLRNGSTVVGELANEEIEVTSESLPTVSLRSAIVRSVEMTDTNGAAQVRLTDGSRLALKVRTDDFVIDSESGRCAVKRDDLRSLQLRSGESQGDTVDRSGLVGWWRFNGDCTDSSGNGNDGFDNGVNFIADRNGKPNSAADFIFMTSAVIVNDSPSLSSITSALSVSLWILPRTEADDRWLPILCKSDRRDCVGSFRVSVYSHYMERFKRKSCFHFDVHGIGDTAGENTPCEEYFLGLIYRKWNHLVITYDGSVHRAYINGVLNHEIKRPVTLGQYHDQLAIGLDFVTDSNYRHFDGSMDDLRLYNRALSEDEVKALYAGDQDNNNER